MSELQNIPIPFDANSGRLVAAASQGWFAGVVGRVNHMHWQKSLSGTIVRVWCVNWVLVQICALIEVGAFNRIGVNATGTPLLAPEQRVLSGPAAVVAIFADFTWVSFRGDPWSGTSIHIRDGSCLHPDVAVVVVW